MLKHIAVAGFSSLAVLFSAASDAAVITITDNTDNISIDAGQNPPLGFNSSVLGEVGTATWIAAGAPQPANPITQVFVLTEGKDGPASDEIRLTLSQGGFFGPNVTLNFRSDAEDAGGLPNVPADATKLVEATDGRPQTIPFLIAGFTDTIRVISDFEPAQIPEPLPISILAVAFSALILARRLFPTR